MDTFSERNGYIKPANIIIREKITEEIQNAICSCYDDLPRLFHRARKFDGYKDMECHLWMYFLNKRKNDFYMDGEQIVATAYMEDACNPWYRKIDLLEATIKYLRDFDSKNNAYNSTAESFIERLNSEFERLRFGYMIFHDLVVPNNAKVEMDEVDEALRHSPNHTQMHLHKALEFYSKRTEHDYPNSIKESISAVEAEYTPITGENLLGKAINKIKCNGNGTIPPKLMNALGALYDYSNMHEIGARHAKKDDETKYEPKEAEAWLMLVCCSAFVNYLRKKPSIFA